MIKKLSMQQTSIAKEVLIIQKQAYKKEAEWLEVKEFPPLTQTVHDLIASDDTFWGYYKKGLLVGVISIEDHRNHIQISRVVVHPDYFGRRIGSQLMEFIIDRYSEKKILVTTGKKNEPALKLYKKYSFSIEKEWDVEKELTLVQLVRQCVN
ncbi:GNAT family N-acetyltransferase [Bacillus seohaeanensis]|jgi:ribosomal protein S18 acetylase RimI-like enzyme|uniref:GNAT family N-acetyltransferase n=1 Tax=Bacillus seohaeanensis TaxID=284580 RepID=A0ABW5RUF6_9BACI